MIKIGQMKALVKVPLGLNVPGVYWISCACGQCYIRWGTTAVCCKEYMKFFDWWCRGRYWLWQSMVGTRAIKLGFWGPKYCSSLHTGGNVWFKNH